MPDTENATVGENLFADAGQESVTDSQEQDSVEITEDGGETTVENTDSAPAEQKPKKQPQSDEDNTAAAAARRQAKREAEAEKQKAIDAEYERLYGMEYDIHSKADYDARIAQNKAAEQARAFQEETGLPYDAVQKAAQAVIENDPELAALREFKRQETQRITEKRELDELHTEFPTLKDKIKSTEDYDLLVPEADIDEAKKLYKAGWTPTDIYWKFNRKTILAGRDAAAKQAALNSLNSKDHVKPTGQGVAVGEVTVPAETIAMYKRMDPGITDAEIQKHYKTTI
jgi:hypothetical protein